MLSQRGIEFEDRDFFKDRFSELELRRILEGSAPSQAFSWRSPSFKRLGLDQGTLTPDDLFRLMVDEPRLIRRPMVRVDDQLIIGGNWIHIEEALT